MRKLISVVVLIFLLCSCTKDKPAVFNPLADQSNNSQTIVYNQVNKEYVLIRDVKSLQSSSDEISEHADSIISGLIATQFVSSGHKVFDLNNDKSADVGFEIINLHEFNVNALPSSFDSLAARVHSLNIQVLDNSTYGYCDALAKDTQISSDGNWTNNTCVLGTFMNAGQFQGRGNKFLAIRLTTGDVKRYGWVQLYCSQHNDTLRIIDYAYQRAGDTPIRAGQMQ